MLNSPAEVVVCASQVPVFVRAGAVIPTRTMASAYQTTADPLVWMIASGAAGEGQLYEDDGESLEFKSGAGATTTMQFTKVCAGAVTRPVGFAWDAVSMPICFTFGRLTIAAPPPQPPSSLKKGGDQLVATALPTNGSFAGMASTRAQWIVLHGAATLPISASCSGAAVSHTPTGVAPGFWITEPPSGSAGASDGINEVLVSQASLVVACGSAPTSEPVTIKLGWA